MDIRWIADISNCFSDSGGTSGASLNGSVLSFRDENSNLYTKSGAGTATLRQRDGNYCIELDGSCYFTRSHTTDAEPGTGQFDVYLAIESTSYAHSGTVWFISKGRDTPTTAGWAMFRSGTAPNVSISVSGYDGSTTATKSRQYSDRLNKKLLLRGRFTGTSVSGSVNNMPEEWTGASDTYSSSITNAAKALNIGASGVGAGLFTGYIYGFELSHSLKDGQSEASTVETFGNLVDGRANLSLSEVFEVEVFSGDGTTGAGKAYPYYRIPAIAALDDGSFLVFAEGRSPTTADADQKAVVCKSVSATGSLGSEVVIDTGASLGIGNPAPIVDGNTVHLIYTNLSSGQKTFYTKTTDGGATWATPTNLTSVTGTNRVSNTAAILCRSGRLLFATVEEQLYYSDDSGATWSAGAALSIGDTVNNELSLTVLQDGTVVIIARTDDSSGSKWVAYSDDEGETIRNAGYNAGLPDAPVQGGIERCGLNEVVFVGCHAFGSGAYSQNNRKSHVLIKSNLVSTTLTDWDRWQGVYNDNAGYASIRHATSGKVAVVSEQGNTPGTFNGDATGYNLVLRLFGNLSTTTSRNQIGTSAGAFSEATSGLTGGRYYVKAYAVDDEGFIGEGDELNFLAVDPASGSALPIIMQLLGA